MRLLDKGRGYNAIYVAWEGFGYPNNLQPAAGAPELTYEQFCANLEAVGVDRLRVKLVGWQGPLGTNADSIEPPPHGTFNDWGGQLQQLCTAALAHGVRLHVIPFDNVEWYRAWPSHAWNTANGGFISDRRQVFTNAQAKAAAKKRIDYIIEVCGSAIGSWELCAEMSFITTPAFWGSDGWNAAHTANIRQKMVPWVSEMASYVKANHTAPVGNGQVFAPAGFGGDVARLRNEIFTVPELDFAMINWYDGDLEAKVRWLRACQNYVGKPCYVEQYAPWALGPNAPYTREPANFSWSKAHEWAAVCGEFGLIGPMRWPEIRPHGNIGQWWGVAHPNMAAIAGISEQYAEYVHLGDWQNHGANWDGNIASSGLSLKSSWGDGRHVTMFLSWSAPGEKVIVISGLVDQAYTLAVFDWISGERVREIGVTASGGRVEIAGVPTRERRVVAYLAQSGTTPPPAPVASFSGTPTSGVAPLSVDFTDTSTGEVTLWSWDFGDGTGSDQQHPTHIYPDVGTYTVDLISTGPGGSDTNTRVDYITVTEEPTNPPTECLMDWDRLETLIETVVERVVREQLDQTKFSGVLSEMH